MNRRLQALRTSFERYMKDCYPSQPLDYTDQYGYSDYSTSKLFLVFLSGWSECEADRFKAKTRADGNWKLKNQILKTENPK